MPVEGSSSTKKRERAGSRPTKQCVDGDAEQGVWCLSSRAIPKQLERNHRYCAAERADKDEATHANLCFSFESSKQRTKERTNHYARSRCARKRGHYIPKVQFIPSKA